MGDIPITNADLPIKTWGNLRLPGPVPSLYFPESPSRSKQHQVVQVMLVEHGKSIAWHLVHLGWLVGGVGWP